MPQTQTRTSFARPPHPLPASVLSATSSAAPNMSSPDDPVILPPTALAIGENLVAILNTIISNLPENELRKMRFAVEQSVRLADDLLYNLSVSSTFYMLNMNEGARVFLSSSHSDPHPRLKQHHRPVMRTSTPLVETFLPPVEISTPPLAPRVLAAPPTTSLLMWVFDHFIISHYSPPARGQSPLLRRPPL